MNRFQEITAILAASMVLATATPHQHHHRRHDVHHKHAEVKRAVQLITVPVEVPVYQYKGKSLSIDEVCGGIAAGTFAFAAGTPNPPDCSKPLTTTTATPTPTPTPSSSSSKAGNVLLQVASSHTSSIPSASPSAASSSAQINSKPVSGISSNPNTDVDFPDGTIPCSQFPSAYGAIDITWMSLGGWSGIQYVKNSGNVAVHIDTAISGGSGCSNPPGATAYCSYACPPGYQKSQWPTIQGDASAATSVGGLKCGSDNKLYLTNSALSTKLCIPGTGNVFVQNKLSSNAAICRTDYPGTESETVPLDTQPASKVPLTCPNGSQYYTHLGKVTSAEYYINMKGVSVDKACVWSTDGTARGNWAPNVLGVGTDASGLTWLSIQSTIQNKPSSYTNLDYTVELQGNFGGSNACFYVNKNNVGYYCSKGSPSNYNPSDCVSFDPNSHPVPGCTVQLMSGQATYVLS